MWNDLKAVKIREVFHGSGNVFNDLGLPGPELRFVKAFISIYIEGIIDENHWTQAEAAKRMGLAQPDVSNILRGRLKGFTLDRLFACLNALDQDVEIKIRPAKSAPARLLVNVTE